MALLEQAAGQGHVYAMRTLGCIHEVRKEHEQAVRWYTKGAEAGLPEVMFHLGCYLSEREGVAGPDCTAAADWYRRAAEAGIPGAANNLSNMYSDGRGLASLGYNARRVACPLLSPRLSI
jgi:hypothetical protein